jgi:hypothetical protein
MNNLKRNQMGKKIFRILLLLLSFYLTVYSSIHHNWLAFSGWLPIFLSNLGDYLEDTIKKLEEKNT